MIWCGRITILAAQCAFADQKLQQNNGGQHGDDRRREIGNRKRELAKIWTCRL